MRWPRPRGGSGLHGERGQSTLWMVGVILVLASIGGALVEFGGEAVLRGRLQAVADLTALAAAQPDLDASTVAFENGARLESIRRDDLVVTVVVVADGRRSIASAALAE